MHSLQSLLADLTTLARNTVVTAIAPNRPFTVMTRPTPIQQKAFDLLAISLACTQQPCPKIGLRPARSMPYAA